MTAQFTSRTELRHTTRQAGTYFRSLTNEDRTTFEDGPVQVLNKSEHGALLEVSRSFHQGDIIEMQCRRGRRQSTIQVLEVRWSQAKGASRYIIGCRLIFSTQVFRVNASGTKREEKKRSRESFLDATG